MNAPACIRSALILAPIIFCCIPGWSQETNQGFIAELNVELDQGFFAEDAEIRGTVQFKLIPPKEWLTSGRPTLRLNNPLVRLIFDPEFEAFPTTIHFEHALENPIRIRQDYKLPFKISMNEHVKRLLPRRRLVPAFTVGPHSVRVEIELPPWAIWAPPPSNAYPELVASFSSAPQQFAIQPAGRKPLTNREIVRALRDADEGWTIALASFFLPRKTLRPEDILPAMLRAQPENKGRLAHLYCKYGGNPEKLAFFHRPSGPIILATHTNVPIFLRLLPNEEVRFVYSGQGGITHNANGLEHNYAVVGSQEKSVRAPATTSVHRIVCDVHSISWCWVLVAPQ